MGQVWSPEPLYVLIPDFRLLIIMSFHKWTRSTHSIWFSDLNCRGEKMIIGDVSTHVSIIIWLLNCSSDQGLAPVQTFQTHFKLFKIQNVAYIVTLFIEYIWSWHYFMREAICLIFQCKLYSFYLVLLPRVVLDAVRSNSWSFAVFVYVYVIASVLSQFGDCTNMATKTEWPELVGKVIQNSHFKIISSCITHYIAA